MIKRYAVGQTIFLKSIFENGQLQLANPQTVVVRVLDPNGVEMRLAVTNVSVGLFTANFTATIAGTWHVRWEAAGNTIQSVDEYTFEVSSSPFQT